MLNLCVFIFIIYAVSYSARVILFGNRRKRRKVAYHTSQKRKVAARKKASPKNNIILIKSGRLEKSRRPVNISDSSNHAIKVTYLTYEFAFFDRRSLVANIFSNRIDYENRCKKNNCRLFIYCNLTVVANITLFPILYDHT